MRSSAIPLLFKRSAAFLACIYLTFAQPALATDDPNGTYRGASLSGDNTYAQVQPTGATFTYRGGTLTLTGNNNGVLFVTSARSPRFTISSDSGPATLALQKGTFTGSIALGGNAASTLIVGAGATTNLPTVTITGNLMGSNNGTSIVRTNGANLTLQGNAGDTSYVGEIAALNGNITMQAGSNQNQVGVIRVNSGMQVLSQTRLTLLDDLDMQRGGQLRVNNDIHIQGKFGLNGNVMRAGSTLWSGGNIFFYPNQLASHTTERGIVNAAGTIHARGEISSNGLAEIADLMMAGTSPAMGSASPLKIEAGGSIYVGTIRAASVTAGGNIVAGVKTSTGVSLPVNGSDLTPTKTITANDISVQGTLAAGEVTDFTDSKGSSVTAGHLFTLKGNDSSGNFKLNRGAFRLTSTEAIGNAEYAPDGSIVSHTEASYIGGDMTVNNNGASSFTTLGVGGDATISGGSLTGDSISANSITLNNGIEANINQLAVNGGASAFFAVGANDDTAGSNAAIQNLALNGSPLRVGAGNAIANAAIASFTEGERQGNYTASDIYVGKGGMLALGTGDFSWLPAIAANQAMPQNAAVLGVAMPFVAGGGLFVDSGWTHPGPRSRAAAASAGAMTFSGNSLLAIDGKASGVAYTSAPIATAALPDSLPGAISAETPTTANVANGAKIYINGVTPGHTYIALGKNIATVYEGGSAWAGANLVSSNPLLGLRRLENGMEGQFSVVEHAPHVTRLAASSGVPRMARAASESMEEAIYHRIRLGQEDLHRRNFALWALPLYEHLNSFNLDAGDGSYGFTGGLGGLAIGCDYTWENMIRLGIAMHMGAGYAKSNGDVATTTNNLNFWGIGAYGVWKPGAFSLDADLDLTWTYNKLKQDLPAGLPASEAKADAPAWALGASLRAQYEFDTDWLIIRPHAGVRYFHLDTEPYDVTVAGKDALRAHRSYQNVWTFPFGIVFTKNFNLGDGYELTPIVNLKAIPASGDIYVKNSVRYTGAARDQEFDTQAMDSITWGGRAGVEFRAGNFNIGINYNAQFGSHTSNQGVFGVLRYEF